MKRVRLLLLIALLVSIVCLPIVYVHYKTKNEVSKEDFFFGVSFGLNTSSEAKLLIDKVKEYTNLFIINSWEISTNETALNEICEYAVNAKMSFIVFFDFISHVAYPWHLTWLDKATERWGSNFLGVYLYDEPGGRQIDWGQWDGGDWLNIVFDRVSDYSDAANRFIASIPSSWSMQDLKNRNIPVFTSDYALYWFDYLAGYDTIFVEFGWNHSRVQHIALGRGAANVQDKQWGVIIVWTYEKPPYLENGPKMLQDLKTAYQAGARYITIFNYPKINPFGILEEEHFTAMKEFWNWTHSSPESPSVKVEGQAAFVFPRDYGWGMRNLDDKIWGFWPPDGLAPEIWDNINKLIKKFDLKLDIIYDDPQFSLGGKYSEIYFWNSTVN